MVTAAATASMTKAACTPEVRSAVVGSAPATSVMTAMLVAVPYFLAANYCLTLIEHGGPGWLNLLVLVFCWNALKFLIMGPIRLVVLVVGLPVGHSLFGLEGALAAIVAAQFSSWPIAYAFKIRHNLFDWRFEGVVIPAVALGLLLGYLVLAGARALGWAA